MPEWPIVDLTDKPAPAAACPLCGSTDPLRFTRVIADGGGGAWPCWHPWHDTLRLPARPDARCTVRAHRLGEDCAALSRFRVRAAAPRSGVWPPVEACEAHLADAVMIAANGDPVPVLVAIRWDPEAAR